MNTDALQSQFLAAIRAEFEEAGLREAEVVEASPVSESFGDTAAVLRLGSLLVRITRDRGQLFVDVASQAAPALFYKFHDIDVAMGWRSVGELWAMREPEPLSAILRRLHANFEVISGAFSSERAHLTKALLAKAAHDRAMEFLSRLRGTK